MLTDAQKQKLKNASRIKRGYKQGDVDFNGDNFSLDLAMSHVTADVICRTVFSTSLDTRVAHEVFDLAGIDPANPMNAHVQGLSEASLSIGGAAPLMGRGLFEQLAIGPHAPSGFKDLFDLAG